MSPPSKNLKTRDSGIKPKPSPKPASRSQPASSSVRSEREPREAALTQAEHDTAGFQRKAAKVAADDADRVARDTARYEALAREHGADLSEEGFNEALKKIGGR